MPSYWIRLARPAYPLTLIEVRRSIEMEMSLDFDRGDAMIASDESRCIALVIYNVVRLGSRICFANEVRRNRHRFFFIRSSLPWRFHRRWPRFIEQRFRAESHISNCNYLS